MIFNNENIDSIIPSNKWFTCVKKPITIRATIVEHDDEIDTLEGVLKTKGGNYVCIGINGEVYPYDKQSFEEKYEKVEVDISDVDDKVSSINFLMEEDKHYTKEEVIKNFGVYRAKYMPVKVTQINEIFKLESTWGLQCGKSGDYVIRQNDKLIYICDKEVFEKTYEKIKQEEISMKNVIITGAANGVGRAVANSLRDEKLILIDNDEVNLKEITENLGADYYICDVADDKQVSNVIENIKGKYDRIDCLINSAGMWISGDMSKLEQPVFDEMNTLERTRKVIDTNVFGVIAMIKSIFPIMKEQGQGQIININSQSGVMCEPPFPVYNASKTAANAFRKAIQDDLARNNIKITDVCPGLIKTDFYKRASNELPEEIMELGLTAEDVADTVKFVYNLPHEITIPAIEVRHIKNY